MIAMVVLIYKIFENTLKNFIYEIFINVLYTFLVYLTNRVKVSIVTTNIKYL